MYQLDKANSLLSNITPRDLGTIRPHEPNWAEKLKNSGLLGEIAYSILNDPFIALQAFPFGVTHPMNLDRSVATPQEKLESGLDFASGLVGPMAKSMKPLKTVNAGQFNQLRLKLSNGQAITAATDGGIHIRQFNHIERQLQGIQEANTGLGYVYDGYNWIFKPMMLQDTFPKY